MGLMDGFLGGVVGAEMATVVNRVIQQHGGVQGIVSQLEQHGLGETVRSWVSTGPNLPVSPQQLHQALGPDTINALAQKLGVPPETLASKLSELLPKAIDQATPEGKVPA